MRKIRFVDVEFRNFLSYGNNWQKFKFNNGLNIIQGMVVETDKSNGSGKSSITELIPFALFGKTIKKINKAKIVNWYNDKQCEVRLIFTVDNVSHKIVRGIKPNKLELWIDGVEQPKLASVTDFQNQIEEDIIGMDFQTFQNLIYFSPNNTISIINAGKPEKRKFLESLFDLTVYSKMSKTINGKMTANETKVAVLANTLDNLNEKVVSLQEYIDTHPLPKTTKYKAQLTGLKMQLDDQEKENFDVDQTMIDNMKEVLQKSKDTLTEWEEKNRKSVAQIDLHQKIIKRIGDLEESKKKRTDIETQILDIEMKMTLNEDIIATEEEMADLTQEKELNKDELKELINTIQGIEKRVAIFESMISNDNDNIQLAENKKRASVGICDSCGQEVTDDILKEITRTQVLGYKLDKDAHERELKEVEDTLIRLQEEKDGLFQTIKDESAVIKDIMEGLERVQQKKDKLKRLQERLKDLPDTVEDQEAVDTGNSIIKEEIKNCSDQGSKIYMAELDIERFDEQYSELKEKLEKKNQRDAKVDVIKAEIRQVEATIADYTELSNTQKKKNEDKQKEIKTTLEETKNTSKSIISSNGLTDYMNYLKVSLKDENVKRFAISSLIPYLNQQTNMYLSESGFPYVVTVDSWLDVEIRGLGVQEVSYGSLSGGETKCIDMAVQLACNDIASMMAKTSLNFMVLDEVLDTSVDGLGVQALINIIRARQKKNNDSVYVITHRNEIDEFTFDSIVRIIQEDKFSRVEVE